MKHLRLLALWLLVAFAHADEPRGDAQRLLYLGDNGVIPLTFQIEINGKSPQQHFEQYIDDLIKSLDANGDGIITTNEVTGKVLTPQDAMDADLIPRSPNSPKSFSIDTEPADGKITRQEFLTYFKRLGIQPFLITYQSRTAPPPTGRRNPRQPVNIPEAPLFLRLDVNGDGKLSADELAGALRTLRKLDLDDDETISAAELNPVANPQQVIASQQSQMPAASTSPFLGIGSDESVPKQVRRMVEKYDTTDPQKSGEAANRSRNQKLSPQELGLPAGEVSRLDGDGDGQLDFDELRQLIMNPDAAVTVTLSIDGSQSMKLDSTIDELHDKLRLTPDGAANINFGTAQLSVARGRYRDSETAESYLKPQFTLADSDANGYLEKSEVDRAFLYGATFENLDTDKNGKVYLDEAVAYFKIRFDAARSRIVLAIDEQGRTLFEILDIDRDRRLSFRELQIAASKLSLWDKDGDGMLSESEIPLQYRLVVSRGMLPAMGGNNVVLNNDAAGGQPERTAGPVWFRKMDKNRDGEISQREFLGTKLMFQTIDLNQDGFIDLSEAVKVAADAENP